VIWRGYTANYLRAADDGQVEILVGARTYRVPNRELLPA
jgi:hypothetical protein